MSWTWFGAGLVIGTVITRLFYTRVVLPKMAILMERMIERSPGRLNRLMGRNDILEDLEVVAESGDIAHMRTWVTRRRAQLDHQALEVAQETAREVL